MYSKKEKLRSAFVKAAEAVVAHKVALLLIVFISLLVWHKVLFQVPVGEGYYYFDPDKNIFLSNLELEDLKNHDIFAQSFFPLLIAVFKDNLLLYMQFQMGVFLAVYFCLYFLLFAVTRHRLISLSATLFFIGSFVGSYTMIAAANYQRFIQRVPNLIPLFISFILLAYFFKKKKRGYALCSYVLFFLSLFFARFSIFLLPLFIFYPLVDYIYSEPKKRTSLSYILPIVYVLTAFLFSSLTSIKPPKNVVEFTLKHPQIIEKTLYQLPSVLVPYDLILLIRDYSNPRLLYPYTQLRGQFLLVIGLIFLISYLRFPEKRSAIFKLYVTSILSLLVVNFFTMYSYDGLPNPLTNFGEDRIYFIPSIFMSIIYASLIWLCFHKRPTLYKWVTGIVIFCYLILNTSQIWSKTEQNQYVSTEMKNFITYVKTVIAPNKVKALIAPSHLVWPGAFVKRFYVKDDLVIDTGYEGWEQRLGNVSIEYINVIDYDFEKSNLEASLSANGVVIDKTKDFRKTKQVNFK